MGNVRWKADNQPENCISDVSWAFTADMIYCWWLFPKEEKVRETFDPAFVFMAACIGAFDAACVQFGAWKIHQSAAGRTEYEQVYQDQTKNSKNHYTKLVNNYIDLIKPKQKNKKRQQTTTQKNTNNYISFTKNNQ